MFSPSKIAAGTNDQVDIACDAFNTVLRRVLFIYKYIIKEPVHVQWFKNDVRCPKKLESLETQTRVAIEVKQISDSSVRVLSKRGNLAHFVFEFITHLSLI